MGPLYVLRSLGFCADFGQAMTKRLVQSAGLYTPRFAVVTSPADLESVELEFPLLPSRWPRARQGVDEHSRIVSAEALKKVCVRLLERFCQPVLVRSTFPAGVHHGGPRDRP